MALDEETKETKEEAALTIDEARGVLRQLASALKPHKSAGESVGSEDEADDENDGRRTKRSRALDRRAGIELMNNVLVPFLENSPNMSARQQGHLARLLLEAAFPPLHVQRVWLRTVEHAIVCAVTTLGREEEDEPSTFVKAIVNGLAQLIGGMVGRGNSRDLMCAMRLTRLVLQAASASIAADLVQAQGSIIGALFKENNAEPCIAKRRGLAVQAVRATLARRPDLLTVYLEYSVSQGVAETSTGGSLILGGIVAEHMTTNACIWSPRRTLTAPPSASDDLARARESLVACFTSEVFVNSSGGATVLPAATIANKLAAALRHNEFTESIAPVLARGLKKSPEQIFRNATVLCGHLRLDLSRYAYDPDPDSGNVGAGLVPAALRQLRSDKEDMREHAALLIRAIARKCSDGAVLARIVADLRGILVDKSAGVLSQWHQRHGTMTGVGALAAAVTCAGKSAAREASVDAVGLLSTFLAGTKESHAPTMTTAIAALGEWLTGVDDFPSPALELYRQGISCSTASVAAPAGAARGESKTSSAAATAQSYRTIAQCYLLSLAHALRENIGLRAQCAPLVPDLLNVVTGAASLTVGAQSQCVLAFDLLACIAACDTESGARLAAAKQWSLLARADSIIFAVLPTDRRQQQLGGEDAACAFCRLLASAARDHAGTAGFFVSASASVGDESSSSSAPWACALVRLLVSPWASVRRLAREAAEACCRQSPTELLQAFAGLVRELAQEDQDARKASIVAGTAALRTAPFSDADSVVETGFNSSVALGANIPASAVMTLALSAVVPKSGITTMMRTEIVPTAMKIAHSPIVSPSQHHATSLWNSIASTLAAGVGSVDGETKNADGDAKARAKAKAAAATFAVLSDESTAADVVEMLLDRRSGIWSELVSEREGARRALATLVQCSPADTDESLVLDDILPALLLHLQEPALEALTDRDLDIYFTPEMRLSPHAEVTSPMPGSEDADASAMASRNQDSRRVKSGRREGLYDADDDQYFAELEKEMAMKKATKATAAAAKPSAKKAVAKKSGGGAKKGGKKKKQDDLSDLFGAADAKKGGGKKKGGSSGGGAKKGASSKAAGSKSKGSDSQPRAAADPYQGLPEDIRAALKSEAEVRARVSALRLRAEAALDALAVIASVSPDRMHDCIPESILVVLPLIRSRLVANLASRALSAIAACVDDSIAHLVGDLVDAVRVVQIERLDDVGELAGRTVFPCRPLFERLLEGLQPLLAMEWSEPLPAASFVVVFQVVRAVLQLVAVSRLVCKGWETALAILMKHADMELVLEDELCDERSESATLKRLRKPMIDTTLRVLATQSRAKPPADAVLTALCRGPPLSPSEWTPMLGDLGLLCGEQHVRFYILRSLLSVNGGEGSRLPTNPLVESRIWVAQYDEDEPTGDLAEQVWNRLFSDRDISPVYAPPLLALLQHPSERVRVVAGKALSEAALERPETCAVTVNRLCSLFESNIPQKVESFEDRKRREAEALLQSAGGRGKGTKLVMAAPASFFTDTDGTNGDGSAADADSGRLARSGVARAFEAFAEASTINLNADGGVEQIFTVLALLVENGMCDRDDTVRREMIAAGMALIGAYGPDHAQALLPELEGHLVRLESASETKDASLDSDDLEAADARKAGAVVLLGSAARHLPAEDPKVARIVSTLVATLATPSESVQKAVADCLAPLVPAVRAQSSDLLETLMGRVTAGESYGERRGAAYGISAVAKGLGLNILKNHNVVDTLKAACQSGTANGRQGALFAFECLSDRMGMLFEPYVINILDILLKSFSDSSKQVCQAAHDAAGAIMSNLSPFGVKLVLPAVLKSLNDSQWRTQQAAIQLLGSMAFCAPKQLSSCLPQIVPKLGEAFSNTHPKVREAGEQALNDICKVIRNPEIAALSPVLKAALSDPANKTRHALESLQSTSFTHAIDPPSLALVVPLLHRGLRDRATETKRTAALIMGSMCSMILDAKDLKPYIKRLLPPLKAILLDPIPDVRALSAKALGSIVAGMGEDAEGLEDIIPWLLRTLKGETSTVERSGGAQGLCEVLTALGADRVTEVLDELLPLAKSHPRFAVREGALWLLVFLPTVMQRDFDRHIALSLEVVLSGLSDEAETVREVALRAGSVLVANFAHSGADILVPALEEGLFHDNWRIRQSSVQLLGDMLFRLGGNKVVDLGTAALDEDDHDGDADSDDDSPSHGVKITSGAAAAIEHALGADRRMSVLSALYMIRSDTSSVVRQHSLMVWKSVVPNTPRCLREILPVLMQQIIGNLGCGNVDKRTLAGRSLGDLVKKLGERVLGDLVPFMQRTLLDPTSDIDMRQGVCLGLSETIASASPKQVEDYLDDFVPAVQEALCDKSDEVREEAARAFQTLHRAAGARAIEHILPQLLGALDGGDEVASGRALQGLQGILANKQESKELLPLLLPKLLHSPITPFHARALGAVSAVTGNSVHFHVGTIVPRLLEELDLASVAVAAASADSDAGVEEQVERLDAIKDCARQFVSSVGDAGVQWLCVEMTKWLDKIREPHMRRWGAWLCGAFVGGTQSEMSAQVPIIIKHLVECMTETESELLEEVRVAMVALNASVAPEVLLDHVDFARNVLMSSVSEARRRKGGVGDGEYLCPLFSLRKGLDSLLPMYKHALMHGTPQNRELAARGIGELVEMTPTDKLRTYVVKLAGPLIRIVTDRYAAPVKAAILQTLTMLLKKGGVVIKPIVPQLQTTFVKALQDPDRAVRTRGAEALGQLMTVSTRVDPLVTELVAGSTNAGDGASGRSIQAAMLDALAGVCRHAGSKVSAAVLESACGAIVPMLGSDDETLRIPAACALAASASNMVESDNTQTLVLDTLLREGCAEEWTLRHGSMLALYHLLRSDRVVPLAEALQGPIAEHVCARFDNEDRVAVRETSIRVLGRLIACVDKCAGVEGADGLLVDLLPVLAAAMQDSAPDVRQAAMWVAKLTAKIGQAGGVAATERCGGRYLRELVPPLMKKVKDTAIRVKLRAERAAVHMLEIHTRAETLTEYVASCADAKEARDVRDYSRRVLQRLAAESDADDDDGGGGGSGEGKV